MNEKSREPEALRDFLCLRFRYRRVRYPHSALPMYVDERIDPTSMAGTHR
nr:MAG TPA: hypothetical protein [Caudoviricetes sp.]